MTQLGVHLRQGTGVAVNDVEAMQWFRKAADKGYDPAQVALGVGLVLGRGQSTGQGKQDFAQAAHWFTEASRQGNPTAQIDLAILYENGWGVTRDLQKARDLFLQASTSPIPEIASQAKELAAQISSPASAPPARPQVEASDTLEKWIVYFGVAAGAYAGYKWLTGPSRETDSSVDSPSAALPEPWVRKDWRGVPCYIGDCKSTLSGR